MPAPEPEPPRPGRRSAAGSWLWPAALALVGLVALIAVLAARPAQVASPTRTDPADLASVEQEAASPTTPPPVGRPEPVAHRIEVVATHPHDPEAYTQGLEWVDDLLLESTGLRGESTIRLVDPASGQPRSLAALDDDLFGEGATVVGDRVWQLTWTSGIALQHRLDDLTEVDRVAYDGEGWGLCATDDRLVMSDGSSQLTFRDPVTFEVTGAIEVTRAGLPLDRLNELECVDGLVWANVYQTTELVQIDPGDGRVVGTADMAALVPDGYEDEINDVANGIAHHPATGRFWLAGKRWPVLYEVELVPESTSEP